MKILIAGANGQLGQALCNAAHDHDLVALASPRLDITKLKQVKEVIEEYHPDLVINAAAYTQVDDAESNPELAFQVNEKGPENLAIATASAGIPLVHTSTDYVFDGSGDRPWLESDTPQPLSVYGKSKLAGEQAVQQKNPRHYIVRTAWLYHLSGKNFLRTMHHLSGRNEVKVVDDQFGSPTNADDLAVGLSHLFGSKDYGVYHLVNSGRASWYELTCEFYRQLGIKTPVIPVISEAFPRPAPRPHNSVLGTERVDGEGQPLILMPTWQQGLEKLVKQLPADWG